MFNQSYTGPDVKYTTGLQMEKEKPGVFFPDFAICDPNPFSADKVLFYFHLYDIEPGVLRYEIG